MQVDRVAYGEEIVFWSRSAGSRTPSKAKVMWLGDQVSDCSTPSVSRCTLQLQRGRGGCRHGWLNPGLSANRMRLLPHGPICRWQMVTWDTMDGMATVPLAMMSSGLSGFSLSHSDAGGTTIPAPTRFLAVSSPTTRRPCAVAHKSMWKQSVCLSSSVSVGQTKWARPGLAEPGFLGKLGHTAQGTR